MKFGLDIVPFGHYSDPRNVMELARAAEESGWDGLFTWDHLGFVEGIPTAEPWITLAAVAATTSHLRIGTAVTPVPRRRLQVLAHELAVLDLLSGGRVIFGAGLGGVPAEFERFGEDGGLKRRAAMLEEGLPLLARLLEGERVEHRGSFYTIEGVSLAPLPAQRPRMPIWIGAVARRARLRAARWDGWIVPNVTEDGRPVRSPERLAAELAEIVALRETSAPFDVAITGATGPGERAVVEAYAAAGVTWWLETVHGYRFEPGEALKRVVAGPPR